MGSAASSRPAASARKAKKASVFANPPTLPRTSCEAKVTHPAKLHITRPLPPDRLPRHGSGEPPRTRISAHPPPLGRPSKSIPIPPPPRHFTNDGREGKPLPNLLELVNSGDEMGLRAALDMYVKASTSFDYGGNFGVGPLHVACYKGRKQCVACFLECLSKTKKSAHTPIDVNAPDEGLGWTPLHYAACANNYKIVHELLSFGNTIATPLDKHTRDPLFIAARAGSAEAAFVLLCFSGPRLLNLRDSNHWTPAQIAASKGHVQVLRVLAAFAPEPSRLFNSLSLDVPFFQYSLEGGRLFHSAYLASSPGFLGKQATSLLMQILHYDESANPMVTMKYLRDSKDNPEGLLSLMMNAVQPWSKRSHALFPPKFRVTVLSIYLASRKFSQQPCPINVVEDICSFLRRPKLASRTWTEWHHDITFPCRIAP